MEGVDSLQFDFIQTSMKRHRREALFFLFVLMGGLWGAISFGTKALWDFKINTAEELQAEMNKLICIKDQW